MKKLLSFVGVGLALAMTVPAGATNCSTAAFKKLKFFGDDTGIITWQSPRVDSPRDANKARLAVSVLFQDGDDYAGAFGNCTGIEGKLLGQVKNLSFDFENETGNPVHIGAGAPRYSVILDEDGTPGVANLSAGHCAAVLPEDTRWSRADFTGRTLAGCDIFADADGTTPAASSNGSSSAWAVFAALHPTWKVVEAFFILDEEGTAFVDRLAFQNEMFTAPNVIVNCPAEASC
jgi:hypothetical protein